MARIGADTSNVTGHSGRRSLITHVLAAKVPPEIIAQTTKHKDPKTLMAYAETTDSTLAEAGLRSAAAHLKKTTATTLGGHALESMINASTAGSSSSNSSTHTSQLQSSSSLSGPQKISKCKFLSNLRVLAPTKQAVSTLNQAKFTTFILTSNNLDINMQQIPPSLSLPLLFLNLD